MRSVDLLKDVCIRLKVPNDCKELAIIVAKFHGKLHQASKMRPETLLEFLMDLDAIRQPARFMDFLKACECDSRGRAGLEDCELPEAELLKKVLQAALSIDAGVIARGIDEADKIKSAVLGARLVAVKQILVVK